MWELYLKIIWNSGVCCDLSFKRPFVFMARKFHTREYLFRSLYAMITFSLALAVIPVTSVTHQDYLMAAILGGAFHGGGLGLVFLAGSSTGGTDLLSTLYIRCSQ